MQRDEFKKESIRCFVLMFAIGLLNNNTYVIINTGAQDLAKAFDKKKLMAAFQMYGLFKKMLDDLRRIRGSVQFKVSAQIPTCG